MHADLTLDPEKTALLIVDLQEDQRSDPLCIAADLDKVLDRSARLLAAARLSNVPVFHAAFVRDFDIRPPRPFEPLADDGGPAFSRRESPLVRPWRPASRNRLRQELPSGKCEGFRGRGWRSSKPPFRWSSSR